MIWEWKLEDNTIAVLKVNTKQNTLCRESIDVENLKSKFKTEGLRLIVVHLENKETVQPQKIAAFSGLSEDELSNGKQLYNLLNGQLIPTVALVDGSCYGAALEIALMCDIRLCTKESRFFFPVGEGILPGVGLADRCRLLLGTDRGDTFKLLEGKVLDADMSVATRLVSWIVENDLYAEAVRFSGKILGEKSLEHIHSIMRCFYAYKNLPYSVEPDIRLEEESKQFSYLVYKAYHNITIQGEV